MDAIRIVIEGDPIPATRPRFNGRRCYQPARNALYRREVEAASRLAMKAKPPMTNALVVEVKLYRRYRPTTRRYGDVDNHLKAIFDGMNQIVFVDDSQIVRCVVEKHKDAENPRAEIVLTEAQGTFSTRTRQRTAESNKAVATARKNH